MTVFDFMSDSPTLTFFLALIIAISIVSIVKVVFFVLPNRVMRHANIRKHGYPPAHCDADGDFVTDDEKS